MTARGVRWSQRRVIVSIHPGRCIIKATQSELSAPCGSFPCHCTDNGAVILALRLARRGATVSPLNRGTDGSTRRDGGTTLDDSGRAAENRDRARSGRSARKTFHMPTDTPCHAAVAGSGAGGRTGRRSAGWAANRGKYVSLALTGAALKAISSHAMGQSRPALPGKQPASFSISLAIPSPGDRVAPAERPPEDVSCSHTPLSKHTLAFSARSLAPAVEAVL